ncbi:sel1 repeat family protein [Deltaproteobacteria bacterium]|nr:sel1 repeat family protein [Deltaproteobacteria bacterium]
MKLNKLLLFSLLLCFVFPIVLNAGQLEDATAAIDNEDYEKAYNLLLPLAEEGNEDAQNTLGVLYVNGQGVEQDTTKGLSLIMKAANQGHEEAKANAYILCYEEAQQGNMGAMHNVGYMCLNGWAGENDPNNCIKLLEVAASNGFTRSASALCQIYKKGMFGLSPDEEKSSYWGSLAEEE